MTYDGEAKMSMDATRSNGATSLRARERANVEVFSLSGLMTPAAVELLGPRIDDAVSRRPVTVVIELSRAALVPESVGAIERLHARVARTGSRLVVAGPSSRARALLRKVRVEPGLVIYPSVPPAPPWAVTGGATHR